MVQRNNAVIEGCMVMINAMPGTRQIGRLRGQVVKVDGDYVTVAFDAQQTWIPGATLLRKECRRVGLPLTEKRLSA